jgi:hypothetical protein
MSNSTSVRIVGLTHHNPEAPMFAQALNEDWDDESDDESAIADRQCPFIDLARSDSISLAVPLATGENQAPSQSPPTELPGLVNADLQVNTEPAIPQWQTFIWGKLSSMSSFYEWKTLIMSLDLQTLQIMAAQLPFQDIDIPPPAADRYQNPSGFLDMPITLNNSRGWRGMVAGSSPQMEVGALRRPFYRTFEERIGDATQELYRHGVRVKETEGIGWQPEHGK